MGSEKFTYGHIVQRSQALYHSLVKFPVARSDVPSQTPFNYRDLRPPI